MGGGSATALISHVKQIMTTRKAIALGLLTTAVVTLLAFGIKHKAFKTTTPNANKRVEVKAENTLIDLTNTKWYFNNTLNNQTPNGTSTTYKPLTTQTESYGIRFTSNNTSYDALAFTLYSNSTHNALRYISRPIPTVYDLETNTWSNTNYKQIRITGGPDVTNTYLINWLFNNATLITINTLENTSWQLNEEITNIPTYQYDINFYCNGLYFDAIRFGYQLSTQSNNAITYGDTSQRCYFYNDTWSYYTPYSKILITEGNGDEENIQLIVWLLNNAKQFTTFNTVLNTKWTFIEHPKSEFENLTYDVQFTSYNKPCQTIKAGYTTNNIQNQIAYGFKTNNTNPYTINTVYDGTQWLNAKWQTIIIINGADVENLSFISFLISNAEGTSYQPIPNNADDYDIENGNFVSLQGLMIQILTMPFTFISQAFNVTLWPNTAWEFNLSNFILGIIAIASLIFIIKLFTSGFAVIGNYTRNKDDKEFKRSQTRLNNAKTKKIEGKKDKE